jgi:hypothetical protein
VSRYGNDTPHGADSEPSRAGKYLIVEIGSRVDVEVVPDRNAQATDTRLLRS